MNAYEQAARSSKVLRLVMAIDSALEGMKIETFSVAAGDYVLAMTDAAWECAARLAGVNPPSVETRAQVVAIYEERCARAALAIAAGAVLETQAANEDQDYAVEVVS